MTASIARTSAGDWVKVFRPNAAAPMRLFCLTPVGGGASFYSAWGANWPDVEVQAVQLPGRERRMAEPPLRRMADLVENLCHALPFDKPFALFGHSLGAVVAHELACTLREHDMPQPTHLFLSACPAPQVARKRHNRHLMPDAELIDHLRTLGGTPEEVLASRELMDMALPMIRADFEIAETHFFTSRSPLSVPMTVSGGTRDPEVGENELAAWRSHTNRAFDLKLYPGDHFYLQPQSRALWRDVLAALVPDRTREWRPSEQVHT